MSAPSEPRVDQTAVIALILGVSSLLLSLITALPALYFGVQAIRAINRSDGRLRGSRLAMTGLVCGAFVTLFTVIGLAALSLLNVQEKSQRAGCANNLRLLGQAIGSYQDHHDGYYPSATVLNPILPPERRLSWQAALVPSLASDRASSKKWAKWIDSIAFEQAWDSSGNTGLRQNVAAFQCPTFAHRLVAEQIGFTSYVGIGGIGLDAPRLPLTDPRAGMMGYDRQLKAANVEAGAGNVMLAVETMQNNGPWPAGGPPTVRGVDPDCERYVGANRPFGGLHREGMNVLWADGSVRFVAEAVHPDAFRKMIPIEGAEAK